MIDMARCVALGTAAWDGDDIIYARMALPALVQEVERLREEVRVLDEQVVGLNEAGIALDADLRAFVEREVKEDENGRLWVDVEDLRALLDRRTVPEEGS